MSDYSEKDVPASVPEKTEVPEKASEGVGDAGMLSMQGDDLHWTAQDGTADHVIYQDSVEDALDDPDKGMSVYNNERVTNSDGSQGIIDSRINNTIVDYKTNDMSRWSVADATRFGHEHGSQVQGYVESVDTPADSQGFIIAAGRPPGDETVQEAYVQAADQHQVEVKFTRGGEPEDIVSSVEEAVTETRMTSKGRSK